MSRPHSFLLAASCAALALLNSSPAGAQATRTASKAADITVFGGFEAAHPDYGINNSYGGMFGADYIRYLHIPVEPSLEFRANFHSSNVVSEHSYLVGLRAAVPFGILKPYGTLLIGPGTIHFPYNPGYTGDNSVVYSYGGGVDIHVIQNFSAKVDFQAQHWNTGEFTYSPTIGTIGVVYTIPFRPRTH